MEKIRFEALKEVEVHIPIPDSELEIHGTLRGDYTSPVAVLAPGLGGWENDSLLLMRLAFWSSEVLRPCG